MGPGSPLRSGALILGVALAAGLALRGATLRLDPPSYVRYGVAWGDEGGWTWPAVYRINQGDWPVTGAPYVAVAPVYFGAQALVLSVLGAGLEQARVLSLVCGLGMVLLLSVMAGWVGGVPAAALAGGMYATLYWAIIFERYAAPEALGVLFLSLAFFLVHARRSSWLTLLVASACAVSAFASKITLVFGFPLIVGLWLLNRRNDRRLLPATTVGRAAFVGGVTALVACYVFVFLQALSPSLPIVAEKVAASRSWSHAVSGVLMRWAIAPLQGDLLLTMPVVWGGLVLAGLRGVPASPVAVRILTGAGLWLLAWWMVVPIHDLKGSRYYLIFVPMVLIGVLGWLGTLRRSWHPGTAKARWLRRTGLWLRGATAVWFALTLAVALSTLGFARARNALFVTLPLAAVAFVTIRSGRRPMAASGPAPLAGAVILVAINLVAEAPRFDAWIRHNPGLGVRAVAAAAPVLPMDGVICSSVSPLLLVGSRGGLQAAHDFYWPDCVVEGTPADWIVIPEDLECPLFDWPDIRPAQARLLAQTPLLRVMLPGEPSVGRPAACAYRIVPLPFALGDRDSHPTRDP